MDGAAGHVPMLILGIETSCDETACGIVADGRDVRASMIASQIVEHAVYGGVVPEIAARAHLHQIDRMVSAALTTAGCSIADIDAIAVTRGPGLIGALLVGVSYAKGLAAAKGCPLIPVDHVHAHIHGALLGDVSIAHLRFPALCLVASGGHTNLYLMQSPTSFQILAQTVDDACGECFDKVAKLLGMAYPGGPAIEAEAKLACGQTVAMPQMVEDKNKLFFSYSGLKTHVSNLIRGKDELWLKEHRPALCFSFQEEALGQLVRKIRSAAHLHPQVSQLLVAGGVAANQRFRDLLQASLRLQCIAPPLSYCSDNGAMIAASAYYIAMEHSEKLTASWDAYSNHAFANS